MTPVLELLELASPACRSEVKLIGGLLEIDSSCSGTTVRVTVSANG